MRTYKVSPAGRALAQALDELGQISDEPDRLTRTFLSPAMARANGGVANFMIGAGLSVRVDGVGNLIGRLSNPGGGAAPRRTLLLGSHLDTVRDAGRFDGALGVLLPIAALAEIRRQQVALPFAVEVLGFSEEEGVRFSSAYLGSKGFTGQLRQTDLELRDAEGVSLEAALARGSADRFALPAAAHRSRDLLGYVEVHIEQGPVLETKGLAVGVVSAIAGQTRGRITFEGEAGHAGTTPMRLRRDALAGAAEFISRVEEVGRATKALVATVGTVTVSPGAPNVIPGSALLSLDVRHPDDRARVRGLQAILRAGRLIARRRGLRFAWARTQENGAVACDAKLARRLEKSVRRVQGRSMNLVSGAGHDAVIMASQTPVAMLFVRCRKGLSHHPDEFASPADIDVALRTMVDFLLQLAADLK